MSTIADKKQDIEMNDSTRQTTKEESHNKETFSSDVEMKNLMSIIINSMYSSKDYYLRELICNSSDAYDKLNALRQEFREKGICLETDHRIII